MILLLFMLIIWAVCGVGAFIVDTIRDIKTNVQRLKDSLNGGIFIFFLEIIGNVISMLLILILMLVYGPIALGCEIRIGFKEKNSAKV